MRDQLFTDARNVTRARDDLQIEYSTGEVVSRIWTELLRPRLGLLIVSSLAMAVTAAMTGAIPFIVQVTADEIFIAKRESMILWVVAAVIAVTAVKAASEYVSNVAITYLGHRFISDLRIQMFAKLARADMSWINQVHSGRLLSGFLNDATLIRQTASRTIVALVENSLKVIVLTGILLYMDVRFAGLVLLFMPIGIYLLGRQRKKMRKSTTKSLQETGDLSALISQMLRGMRVVRAYGQEDREIGRAQQTIERVLEFTMRGSRARASSSPLVEILTGCGFALAIYFAAVQGISGALTLGHFMGFMAAAVLIYQPLKSVAAMQTQIQEGVAAASRVFGIIDREATLKEAERAEPLDVSRGEIAFDDVSFGYEPGSLVLKGVDLVVPAGKTVALVGPSGSGKSTMVNLVLRFFDPSGGAVRIDGQDISQVTIASMREATALVTQDPVLFDESLRANIAYGASEIDDAAVIAAAKAAAAHEFISALPKGYDTKAGEAGISLSGGERQRIAIARAVYKNAPILLLDEPTSSLDSEAEAKVQAALERLMLGKTVLMIAHRLSTVQKADLICVLDQGRIIETGRHEELVARGGLYARLHKTQLGLTGADKRAERPQPIVAIAGE